MSTKPMWKRIGRLRNLRNRAGIQTLVKDGNEFSKDEQKAKIFGKRMRGVFNDNKIFDQDFKNRVEEMVNTKWYDQLYSNKSVKKFTDKELKFA